MSAPLNRHSPAEKLHKDTSEKLGQIQRKKMPPFKVYSMTKRLDEILSRIKSRS